MNTREWTIRVPLPFGARVTLRRFQRWHHRIDRRPYWFHAHPDGGPVLKCSDLPWRATVTGFGMRLRHGSFSFEFRRAEAAR